MCARALLLCSRTDVLLCNNNTSLMSEQGKWRLGPRIGSGSFGTVHKGMNEETGQVN
jgi:hypothetical protein